MSQNNFHSLYVAPLIVAVLGAVISAVIGMYYFNQSPNASSSQPSTLSALQTPVSTPQDEKPLAAAPYEFPSDPATQILLREFIHDAAAAKAKYQGKEIRVTSIIASIEPSGVLELYGATTKNQVEGMYFKCSLQEKADAKGLERNQLVTLKGQLKTYIYHHRSPQIIVESCRLIQP